MTFDQIFAGSKPTVVFFYGPACAPCSRLKPRMASLKEKLGFEMEMINVASDLDAARALGIRNVPTVVTVTGNCGSADVLFTGEKTDAEIEQMLKARGFA